MDQMSKPLFMKLMRQNQLFETGFEANFNSIQTFKDEDTYNFEYQCQIDDIDLSPDKVQFPK
jgi:hypothetical protein